MFKIGEIKSKCKIHIPTNFGLTRESERNESSLRKVKVQNFVNFFPKFFCYSKNCNVIISKM